MPSAFKLDHLQPFKPILFPNYDTFLTFILGANSYYPTGPFATLSAHFVSKLLHLSRIHTGSQFLLPQRANNGEMGILTTLEKNETVLGERNNEFAGLSLNPEESFFIVGIVTHYLESHHKKLCTNISHFDLLYLLSFEFYQKYSSN